MPEQPYRGPGAVGWLDGRPVPADALAEFERRLAGLPVGVRVGLDGSGPATTTTGAAASAHATTTGATTTGATTPGATTPAGRSTADPHRTAALRTWATRTLLLDNLAASEALRIGVTDPGSPAQWVARLEATGEVRCPPPHPAEIRACYDANIHRYRVPEARHTRHLLVADRPSADELLTAVDTAAELASLAATVSLDRGTAWRGGDLGWVHRGQLAGSLEEAIFQAPPGDLTGPVASPFGWHLLVVEEVRAGRTRPFAECQDEIRAELWEERRRAEWRHWWERRVAEAISVPPGSERVLLPGLPGTAHRH